MRIFITGATGFLGRPLCQSLTGHELLLLSRTSPQGSQHGPHRAVACDLFEPASWLGSVKNFAPDCCIHLAWAGLPDYSLAITRRNFDGGLNLFQALREIGCPRVIATGSCWEYGDLSGALREDQLPGRQGVFGAFKSAQQMIGQSLLSDAGIRLIWTRPFFIYGPGQRAGSLIPSCISAFAHGRTPEIRSPDAVQDFIHVEDVARALAALVTAPSADGIYNLGSGQPRRVRDMVNVVARLMNQLAFDPPRTDAPAGMWADISRIRNDTGWEPQLSLEKGIGKTLEQWRMRP